MGFISLKKLSEQTKIDFYQLEKYIKYMGFDVTEENKIKSVNLDYVDTIKTFLEKYSTNEISYMISHDIPYNFKGTLLLNLRKKYNLNEKQFKSKCANTDLEFKYVYDDKECKKFDDFMNQKLNKAELRDLKYIKKGWIPLRDIIKEFGEKYDLCENTASSILDYLEIEIYKPLHQLSFISEEQKKQFEDFLKHFNSSNERKLYLQEQTCMEKYGVKNPSHAEQSKYKISESSKKKIKFATSKNLITAKELAKLFKKDKHTIIDVIQLLNIKITTFETDNHYYISKNDVFILEDYFSKTEMSGTSYSEKEIVDFIKSICDYEVIENSRNIIYPKELDVYIPNKKVAIEFDGLHWHDENHVDKNYHLIKTEMCNEKGIDLIHVFEDDWLYKKEIVKSMIASRIGVYKEKIFARNCQIKEIEKDQAKIFFDENHLQGFAYGDLYLGLMFNDELIQCICINKKGWHDGNVELTRMVTKLNIQVVGGFSKLMKHISDYIEYKSITSYVYKAWFNGKGYIESGFKIVKENNPSYSYVVNGRRVHKSYFRKDKIKKMYKNGELKFYDSNKTEHENMLENKIYRIYDCGTVKVNYK